MTRRSLVPIAAPSLAIAVGATTPSGVVVGALIYSSSVSRYLFWNGTSWQPVGTPYASAPPAIAAAGSAGSVNDLARGDHTHAHGTQTDGTMHAVATTTVAGFQSAADKVKVNTIPTFVQTSAGPTDAAKGVLLNSNGDLDSSMLPPGLIQDTVLISSAATNTSATTGADVTGLVMAVPSAGTYELEYLVLYQTATSTTGIKFGFNSGGPAFSSFVFAGNVHITATTDAPMIGLAYGSYVGATTGPGASTTRLARFKVLATFTATGNLTVQIASSASASQVTALAGSVVKMRKLA